MAKDEIVRTNVGVAENVVAGASKKSELDALLLKKKKADAALKEEARADAEQEVSAASDEAVELEAAPAAAAVAAADAGSFIVTESDVGGLIAQAAGGVSNTALLVGGGVLLAGAAVAIASNSDDGDDDNDDDGTVNPPNVTVTSITPAATAVTEGDSINFAIKGTPGATITYTVGGTTTGADTGPRSGQVVLDSQGNGVIVVAVASDNEVDAAETITVTAGGVTSAAVTVTDTNTNTGGVQLTAGTDVRSANVFTAGLVFNPGGTDRVNSLQDEDALTGTGANPTLNATLGNANDNGGTSITPTLTGISTVNVEFTGNNSGGNQGNAAVNRLDLQDATGVDTAVRITRITDASNNAQIDNLNSVPVDLGLANVSSPTATVGFNFNTGAAAADNNTTKLTLDRVNVVGLSVEDSSTTINAPFIGAQVGLVGLSNGVETIDLVSTGAANTVGTFSAEDLRTLNITGAQNLTLGGTTNTIGAQNVEAIRYVNGLANVGGSLNNVNAAAFTGVLTYNIGGEINANVDGLSGGPVNLTVTGGTQSDIFRLTAGTNVDAGDRINGGGGTDNRLVLLGNNVINTTAAATPGATVTNVQTVEVRTGHDADAAADTVNLNGTAIADLSAVLYRNEGQTAGPNNTGISAAEVATLNLTNLNAATANGITLLHGTTGNNGLGNNNINVNSVVAGVNTVGITLQDQAGVFDSVNADPRFNARLAGAAALVNVNIRDQDTGESNSIDLVNVNNHTGTISLTGGAVGEFLNLDSTGNALRLDQTGLAVDGGTNLGDGHRTDVGGVTQDANGNLIDRLIAANINATGHVGNVFVRVSDSDNNLGGQNIQMGTGNDTVIFDQVLASAVNRRTAGLTISDTVSGGAGTDTLALDGNGVKVSVGASEWTNVTGFEIIRLIGNDPGDALGLEDNARNTPNGNAYNLTLTNDLLANNNTADGNVRRISIINDNDSSNDAVGVVDDFSAVAGTFGATGQEQGVNIDATRLSANNSFRYNGEEGATRTADRFIFEDANINGTAIIDGGRVYGAANVASNLRNEDVIEVRKSAVVSLGDLAGISNVGTLEFTNDSSVAVSSFLELNNIALDRLVNNSRAADSANVETLIVRAFDNVNVPNAVTNLTIEASTVTTTAFGLDIATQNGADRVLLDAASSGSQARINLGGQGAGLNDVLELRNAVAGETYDIVAGAQAGVNVLRITSANGQIIRNIDITGVEQIDVSGFDAAALGRLQDAVGVNVNGTAFVNNTPGPVVPPPAGLNPVAVTAGTVAPVAGTAAADSFNFSETAARATGDNTVITINGFTVAADRLNLDAVNAPTTLQALNGTNGITVQTSLAGNTVASFGPDANGDLISLTFTGIADPSTIQVI